MENNFQSLKNRVLLVLLGLTALTILLPRLSLGAEVKTLRLSDDLVAVVKISTRGTVLSFPLKPTKVILGKAGSFGIEYVENDLAISPLSLNARSNLFVYLFGRRFSFDLIATSGDSSSVVLVRDAKAPSESNEQRGK